MRQGVRSFKEFHKLSDWKSYISTYMANTMQQDANTEIKIVTGRGETIAVWQKHGYGFIEECRNANRLDEESRTS